MILVNLLTLSSGYSFAWTSPVIQKITGKRGPENNPFGRNITVDEEAWLASLLLVGILLGCLFGGYLSARLGKKKALLLSGIPLLIASPAMSFCAVIEIYFIGRFFSGITCGVCFTIVPLYIGEIAEKSKRGEYGCYFAVSFKIGVCIAYAAGQYTSLMLFNLICCIPVGLFLIIFYLFYPETPYHLVSIGDIRQAEKSLKKFRKFKTEIDVQIELQNIEEYLKDQTKCKKNIRTILKNKSTRKSLFLATLLLFLQQCSGLSVILAYLEHILAEAGSTLKPEISSIIVGITQIFATLASLKLIEKRGRRFLLIGSVACTFLSLLTLSMYFVFKHKNYDIGFVSWLPLCSLIAYFTAYSCGLGPIGWTYGGEIFETSAQSCSSAIAHCTAFVSAFLTTFCFPYMSLYLGLEGSFAIFACFVFLGLIFIVLFVPETKNKSFAEIKSLLDGRWLQAL